MSKPKWRRFEDLAAAIQRSFTPTARITQNERMIGRRSGRSREIDIAIRQSIGQYEILIVIDCKDYKRKVNVKNVETFMGLVDDVAANHAAIIAASNFSEAAKRRAEDAGIRLFRLVDTEQHDWRAYVSIPTVADVRSIKAFSLMFSPFGRGPFSFLPQDPRVMQLLRSDGAIIELTSNRVVDLWESGEIPQEPGIHREIMLAEEDTFIRMADGKLCRMNVSANVIVERHLYFGMLPLENIKALKDEVKGTILTTGYSTEFFSVDEISRTWKEIQSRAELAVQPALEFCAITSAERIRQPA